MSAAALAAYWAAEIAAILAEIRERAARGETWETSAAYADAVECLRGARYELRLAEAGQRGGE